MNRDGGHSWECCGTNVGPSIKLIQSMQGNDIDHLQIEVKDTGIGTGNGNEELASNFGGRPVSNAPGKQDDLCALPADATSTSIALSPHFSKLTTFIG